MTVRSGPERGSTLIVVILVMAFMLSVGAAVLFITGIAPKVSGSVRDQEDAFNAAEAGFEAARIQIETNLLSGAWTSLNSSCLTTPSGIDQPSQPNYFRKQTDISLVQTLTSGTTGVLFANQPFTQTSSGKNDTTRTYTVFLINQGQPSDALLITIGVIWTPSGQVLATSRLEVDLGTSSSGSMP
jgi:Tfp pilus assembly protein PilX